MQDSIQEQPTVVTPEGVRDGDPAALSGLTTRRGSAVMAYAARVAAPGEATDAAAEAFAWFRRAVVEAADPYAVDPERTLLRGARYTAASHAPRELPLRARLRGGASPCELVPELLAARAERELGEADLSRLTRHLDRCESCRIAQERFRVGERAYRDAPDEPPPPFASRAIMSALLAAAPNAHATVPAPALDVEPTHAPPAPALDGRYEHETLDGGEYRAARIRHPGDDALGHTVPFTPIDVVDSEPDAAGPLPHAPSEEVAFDAELAEAVLAARARMDQDLGERHEPSAATLLADPILEPTAHFTDERQPTYEFDALPAEAFDLYPQADPRRRRSPLAILGLLLLAIVVIAALAVVAMAVSDVLSH
jgi:hypothetical protein